MVKYYKLTLSLSDQGFRLKSATITAGFRDDQEAITPAWVSDIGAETEVGEANRCHSCGRPFGYVGQLAVGKAVCPRCVAFLDVVTECVVAGQPDELEGRMSTESHPCGNCLIHGFALLPKCSPDIFGGGPVLSRDFAR